MPVVTRNRDGVASRSSFPPFLSPVAPSPLGRRPGNKLCTMIRLAFLPALPSPFLSLKKKPGSKKIDPSYAWDFSGLLPGHVYFSNPGAWVNRNSDRERQGERGGGA